ncbi:MAG: NADH-quinone oxidoreductase subunit M [Magnetococcales bacterium]|nr:NADH-quinone oxidoreductase subunit M [Magnetococcales bacterium]
MTLLDLPLLSLLIGLPMAGALCAWIVPNGRLARSVALACGILELLLALAAVAAVDFSGSGFQLLERHSWIPSLGVTYLVGVDGLSVLFLPAGALLFLATLVASWNLANRVMPRFYFALLLLFEGLTLGIFCALDTILFFFFWELTLIPIYFLVALWGVGPNRRHAAVKYTLFMLAGGAALLFGLLLTTLAHPGPHTFDLTRLLAEPLSREAQWPVFFLLLIGFGVKIPIVPLHVWLPIVAMEGPVVIAAIMTGLKLGAYGLLRFLFPLTPLVARELHWLLVGLAVVTIVYGALSALSQSNLRRLLAFSSIGHVGLVVLGLSSFTVEGVQGAVAQLLNFSLVSGGLFLMAGFLHQRLGSTDLIHLGGLSRPLPVLAGCVLFFGLAGMGMPMTSGFPGELLLLTSALRDHIGSGLAALGGVILGAGYFLGFYRKAFLGPLGTGVPGVLPALLPREQAILMVFGLLILVAGWFPDAVLLDPTRAAAQAWVEQVGGVGIPGR